MRKPVDYTANDFEIEDLDQSVDQGDKKSSGLGQAKENNAQNLSRGEGLDEDYLEKGGGFCPDNDDNDGPDVSQRGNPCLEGDFSEEFLRTGGGFCMDEGENVKSISGPATVAILESDNLFQCSRLGLKAAHVSEPTMDQAKSITKNDQSKSGTSLQERETDNTRTTPVGALCAMPLLRKKRRKS